MTAKELLPLLRLHLSRGLDPLGLPLEVHGCLVVWLLSGRRSVGWRRKGPGLRCVWGVA